MKSVSAEGTTISVHRWSKCGKVPHKLKFETRNVMIVAQRSDSQSNALTRSPIPAPQSYRNLIDSIDETQIYCYLFNSMVLL